jgi:hypothetical protein
MSSRADQLAQRVMLGADAMAEFAERLSEAEWRTAVPPDGRTAGVIIHHVAIAYPGEIECAKLLAAGTALQVTWEWVAQYNATHAQEHAEIAKDEAIELLRRNSDKAAEAVRGFTDAELDSAAPVGAYADAPLTAQFFIEDQAVRHSFHHLKKIKAALGK